MKFLSLHDKTVQRQSRRGPTAIYAGDIISDIRDPLGAFWLYPLDAEARSVDRALNLNEADLALRQAAIKSLPRNIRALVYQSANAQHDDAA